MSIQLYRCTVDLREEACNKLWNVQLNDVFFGLRYVLLRQECLPNGRKPIQTSSQLRVLGRQHPYFVPCKKTQVGVNHGSNCARPELRSTCKDLRDRRLTDQSSLLVKAIEAITKQPSTHSGTSRYSERGSVQRPLQRMLLDSRTLAECGSLARPDVHSTGS